MNIGKTVLLKLMTCVPIMVSAQAKNYQLFGTIKDFHRGEKIYFKVYATENNDSFDSTVVIGGKFFFKGICKEPEMALLYLNHSPGNLKMKKGVDYLPLYIDQGSFHIYIKDSVKTAVIYNSKINTDWESYKAFISKPMDAYEKINAEYRNSSPDKQKDTTYKAYVTKKSMEIALQIKALQKSYLLRFPNSSYRLYALQDYAGRVVDAADVGPIFNSLPKKVKATSVGKTLAKAIQAANLISTGSIAPSFVQNNTYKQKISLDSYKGKYVLLDFWASWCLPCRVELPNVVNLYHHYKEKNFTVLSISLDNQAQKNDWLKAIKQLDMQWENLSDLNGRSNKVAILYKVATIPQNFLIDPNGVIIGKNLIGRELENKLAELFNSNKTSN